MNFTFFHRPEPRKFKYKPRFYTPEEEARPTDGSYDPNRFAEKLHRSWNRRRPSTGGTKAANARTLVWIIFLAILLGYLLFKLF